MRAGACKCLPELVWNFIHSRNKFELQLLVTHASCVFIALVAVHGAHSTDYTQLMALRVYVAQGE